MTNIELLSAYIPMLLIVVIITIISIIRNRKSRIYGSFMIICALVIFWYLSSITMIASRSFFVSKLMHELKIIPIAFLPVAFIRFVAVYYGNDQLGKTKTLFLLCIIPIITVILIFTNDFHHLFRTRLTVIQTYPSSIIINVRGPWYWVHAIYSYGLSLVALIICLWQQKRLPKIYRFTSYLTAFGVSSLFITSLIGILTGIGNDMDLTFIGLCICIVSVYIGVSASESGDFAINARYEAFNSFPNYIFITDINENIMDINPAGSKWLSSIGIDYKDKKISTVINYIKGKEATFEKNEESSNGNGLIYYDEGNVVAFKIHRSTIKDSNQVAKGFLFVFDDISETREYIVDLEKNSLTDPLTGVYNRRKFDELVDSLDKNKYYPITVVVGDVNDLKAINDTYGHDEGDKMLISSSKAMLFHCPSNGFLTRTGGDEFAMLIPNTTIEEGEEIVKTIDEYLKSQTDTNMNYKLSIALGCATKYSGDESLLDYVKMADKKMYESKRYNRRRR